MSDLSLTRTVRVIAALGAFLGVAGVLVIELGTDYDQPWLADGTGLSLLLSAFFAVFVWLVSAREPRNAAVWAMALSGLGAGLYLGCFAAAAMIVDDALLVLGEPYIPSAVPATAAWLVVLATAGVYVGLYAWLTFGVLLFPDGRLPSPRWRWLGFMSAVGLALAIAGAAWESRPGSSLPVTEDTPLLLIGASLVTLAAALSLVALIVRFRRSTGVARDQFKWVAWGAVVMVPWFVAAFFAGGSESAEAIVLPPLHLAVAVMLTAYGIALGKYRLFDVDVVISKTLTYSLLAVVLALLYGAAVLGFVLIFGDPDQRGGDLGLALPLAATALVAIVFEPLRARLQRLANRIAYGRRAAPHQMLSRLTTRLAEADAGEGFSDLAELLLGGTGAEEARVWVRVGDRLKLEASLPEGAGSEAWVDSVDHLPSSETELSVAVRHTGELLGAIGIAKPKQHPVTPADVSLLTDAAAGVGLLLRNHRLNAELAGRAVQVQLSRRRLIEAQDAARHRLERDLHDGAQQQVVALKVRLGLAKAVAEREGLPDIAERVTGLSDEVQDAIDAMRTIARGIYPPLLEAEGLVAALSAASRTGALPIEVRADDLPRYSVQIEQTAYFCVLAALNRAREAGASSARIDLRGTDETLRFSVAFDADDPGNVTELADRVEAFGGVVATSITPPTTIEVVMPASLEILETA
jgi:signal transduction histidine kinase